MFLSHSANKPPDKSGTSAPSNPSASSQSNAKQPKSVPYSKVHRLTTKIQERLVHAPNVPSLSPSTNSSSEILQDAVPVVIDTVYWGVSQSPGSLFFDVTTRKESERTLYKLAFYQFQDFVGQLVHKSGANRYLEINFDNEENKNEAITKGLQFDKGNIIIRPAVGLTPGSIIKKINLQRLPWLRPKELLAGLTATLSNYGVIRDVGIIRDADTGTFLGSGYATLEITPTLVSEGQPPFLELSHVLTWIDPEISRCGKIFIHAYWNDMPVYCKYCHKTGHNVAACPASPSGRRVCYRCLERGHLRADCPLKKTGLKRSRQGKRVAKDVSPSVPQPNIEPTTDILSDSPLLPTQTAQTDKEAAVPMTTEFLYSVDTTDDSSASSISTQPTLTSSAQSKYASNPAVSSDPERDTTTADDLAISMECDESFSFYDSSMNSSPVSADDSTSMVVDSTSLLPMQMDVPQGDLSTATPTTELINNAASSTKILRHTVAYKIVQVFCIFCFCKLYRYKNDK